MKAPLLLIIPLILLTDIIDTASQLFLKTAINRLDMRVNSLSSVMRFFLRLIQVPKLWLSFTLSTLSLLGWLFVLSRADLNLAYCLDSMRYILIPLASLIFLKERIGPMRWLGITGIVLGIIMVSLT